MQGDNLYAKCYYINAYPQLYMCVCVDCGRVQVERCGEREPYYFKIMFTNNAIKVYAINSLVVICHRHRCRRRRCRRRRCRRRRRCSGNSSHARFDDGHNSDGRLRQNRISRWPDCRFYLQRVGCLGGYYTYLYLYIQQLKCVPCTMFGTAAVAAFAIGRHTLIALIHTYMMHHSQLSSNGRRHEHTT